MITIHAVMLVTLGFLGATLLGLSIVPAYRRRVSRLTTETIKQAMPLTEAEIRADKDRLRADYAIVIHEINAKLEKRSLDVARQRVEINRRDAAISGLEGEVVRMRTSLEEHENARRVLEHTIMDRMPKVELRLSEARKLLIQRDRELAKLSTSSRKQSSALDEATQINAQNRDEIHRLNAALATRAARSREVGTGDRRFDGEVALRSEIEALRAKTRDQATLIARLQGLLERAGGAAAGAVSVGTARGGLLPGGSGATGSERGNGKDGSGRAGKGGPVAMVKAEDEITRLREDLNEAEAALRLVRSNAEDNKADRSTLLDELRVVKAQNEDQLAEISKLKAGLHMYEDMDANERAIRSSKAAMKVRISELTALDDEHRSIISRLRAEVAAGNEKLARQASHYMNEMRRLGAGSMPMAAPGAGGRAGGAEADGSGVRDTRRTTGGSRAGGRRALSDRIVDPRQRELVSGGRVGTGAATTGAQGNGDGFGQGGDMVEAHVQVTTGARDVGAVAGGGGVDGSGANTGVANDAGGPDDLNSGAKQPAPATALAAALSGDDPKRAAVGMMEGVRQAAKGGATGAAEGDPGASSDTAAKGSDAKSQGGRRGGLMARITRLDGTK